MARPVTLPPPRSVLHRGRNFDRLLCAYSSPRAAYDIMNEADAMYAHALFALKDRNLGTLEANFATNICDLLDFIQDHGWSLASDIEAGRIWSYERPEDLETEAAEAALNTALGGPDPSRAKEVRELLGRAFSVPLLWPRMKLVITVTGGNFEAATVRLRRLLCGVPIYSPFYASTEGLLGINICPSQDGVPEYLLDAGSMVFEFLQLREAGSNNAHEHATLRAWEVEVGHAYEILVTTRGGLCRYRMGDVVRVVGNLPSWLAFAKLLGLVESPWQQKPRNLADCQASWVRCLWSHWRVVLASTSPCQMVSLRSPASAEL